MIYYRSIINILEIILYLTGGFLKICYGYMLIISLSSWSRWVSRSKVTSLAKCWKPGLSVFLWSDLWSWSGCWYCYKYYKGIIARWLRGRLRNFQISLLLYCCIYVLVLLLFRRFYHLQNVILCSMLIHT